MKALNQENKQSEEIYAFAVADGLPLRIVMAGITFPDPSYQIKRAKDRNHIFVFEYIYEGKGYLQIDGRKYTANAGDTYILTPQTEEFYCADKNQPFKKAWINLESSYLAALLASHGLTYGTYKFDSSLYFDRILSIARTQTSTAAASKAIAPLLTEMIADMSQLYKQRESKTPAFIAKQLIEAGASAAFSQEALAKKLHVSVSTLQRVFIKAYGITPYEYYLSCKEQTAKTLLENTGMSAKEIAYRLGFSDEHYFSNFFKKRTGKRPIEYKRDFFEK